MAAPAHILEPSNNGTGRGKMVTVIYTKPHKSCADGFWLIGWSKTQFEKAKCNIFHKGDYQSAVDKINSYPCKKYQKRWATPAPAAALPGIWNGL